LSDVDEKIFQLDSGKHIRQMKKGNSIVCV